MCWNIDKFSTRVLARNLINVVRNCGLGNTTLDYITKVLCSSSEWNNGVQGVPADIIIIVEPVSGTQGKGQAATGTCITAQAQLIAALNTFIGNQNLQDRYHFAGTPQQNIASRESMSIIYNNIVLNYADSGALRDNTDGWLAPRAPFWAQFTTVAAPNTPINIIGIHSPQKGENRGGAEYQYNRQLEYADALATIPEIIQQAESVIIAGDYNCSTRSQRKRQIIDEGRRRSVRVPGFENLTALNYNTQIPNPMLGPPDIPLNIYSSVRRRVNNNEEYPMNYLSEAYDTALYHLVNLLNPRQQVNNLIGTAQNTIGPVQNGVNVVQNGPLSPAYVRPLLDNYRKVSDHFPTTTLFDYPDPPTVQAE